MIFGIWTYGCLLILLFRAKKKEKKKTILYIYIYITKYNNFAVAHQCDDSVRANLNILFEGKLTTCKAVAAICHLDT